MDGYGNTLKYYNFLDLKGLSDRLTENPNKNDASFGKKLIYFSESKTKLFSLNDYYMILFKKLGEFRGWFYREYPMEYSCWFQDGYD